MNEYTEADMKFDSDPLMQEEDYAEESAFDMQLREARVEWNEWWGVRNGTIKILYCQLLLDLCPIVNGVMAGTVLDGDYEVDEEDWEELRQLGREGQYWTRRFFQLTGEEENNVRL